MSKIVSFDDMISNAKGKALEQKMRPWARFPVLLVWLSIVCSVLFVKPDCLAAATISTGMNMVEFVIVFWRMSAHCG
ncbi:MAG: hypothetical protein KKA55_01555 [Proteobacteria bacterium]|nr:hypothetical protein [Pseudomonadota bacterium]MBU1594206.1 hypothetical protein [Pseudomonadota bacterium]